MFSNELKILKNNIKIILYPIFFDFLLILIIVLWNRFNDTSTLSLNLTVSTGLPTINNILPFRNNLFTMFFLMENMIPFRITVYILCFLAMMIIVPFFQAGYIGLLIEVGVGNKPTFDDFFSNGFFYCFRFLRVLIILSSFSIGIVLLTQHYHILGFMIGNIVFLLFRVKFIYWEYMIILEDKGIIVSLIRSGKAFKRLIFKKDFFKIVICFLALNGLLSFLLGFFPSKILFLFCALLYSFFGTLFSLTILNTLPTFQPSKEEIAKRTYFPTLSKEL